MRKSAMVIFLMLANFSSKALPPSSYSCLLPQIRTQFRVNTSSPARRGTP